MTAELLRLLTSNEGATLVSGFGGAVAGSAFSLYFSFRRENDRARIARFEKSYQLATISGLICKEALGLKRQFLFEAISDYKRQRELVISALGVPTKNKEIHAKLDLVKFGANDYLSHTLIGELGASVSRDLECLSYTAATILDASNIKTLLEVRNKWIDDFRADQNCSEYDGLAKYFGFPMANGSVDVLFYNTSVSLLETCDNLIRSSYLLYRSLLRHAMRDRAKISSSMRSSYPISFFDFSEYADQGIFPTMEALVQESDRKSSKRLPFESLDQHIEFQINSYLPLY